MKLWRSTLLFALRSGIKYCFKPVDGNYPELDEAEFAGTPDEGGFVDYIASVVESERKRLFFAGYVAGAYDTFKDISTLLIPSESSNSFVIHSKLIFDPQVSRIGASRRWDEEEDDTRQSTDPVPSSKPTPTEFPTTKDL